MIERQAITLRTATTDDADSIASLFTDEGYPAGPSDIVERLGRFASPHSQVIVADHEGEILGFVAIHALPRLEHSDRVLRVMALVVEAGVRDRGMCSDSFASTGASSRSRGGPVDDDTASETGMTRDHSGHRPFGQ